MTSTRFCKALALVLGLAASATVGAHGVRFGFSFAFPLYPPAWYYPPPAYYYPPVAAAPAPPVYIERRDEATVAPRDHYWYYCPDSKMYYPYVKECRSSWQRVSPRPPGL